MKKLRADTKIDVRNLIAPISLLMVSNILAKMERGQVAEVLCADGETKAVLIDILRNSKNRCLGVDETADNFVILIEKGI